jgi:hypothetical protein
MRQFRMTQQTLLWGGDLPRSADIRVLGVSVFAPKADAGADADVVIANATNLSRQTISDNLPPVFSKGDEEPTSFILGDTSHMDYSVLINRKTSVAAAGEIRFYLPTKPLTFSFAECRINDWLW